MLNACAASGPASREGFGASAGALEGALRQLGLEAFRPGQQEAVDAVLQGRDAVVLMPTGAGKSACYLLPALLLPGVTVVVSPLVALMSQQVARARQRGVAALALTAGMGGRARALDEVARGGWRLVFAAPEGLRSPRVQEALRTAGVALLAVDEAHCISAWGYEFRPDYARLGQLRRLLAPRSTLALTATATPAVTADIVSSLGLAAPRVVCTGFDRPNLRLSVRNAAGRVPRVAVVADSLRKSLAGGGAGIVYCATRRHAEQVASALRETGIAAEAYHAGMDAPHRARVQAAWEGGGVPVVCATTAFGMGVDKPDVRVVVHHGLPRSLEAYFQEVGRAGRDGRPADGVLVFDPADLRQAHHALARATVTAADVSSAWAVVRARARADGWLAPGVTALERALDMVGVHGSAVVLLLAGGWLVQDAEGVRLGADAPERLDVDGSWLARRRAVEHERLAQVERYLHAARCRRAFLVDHFQPGQGAACGVCDVCRGGAVAAPTEPQRVAVLKVLSCVARMMGRFGRQRVVEVLAGSRAGQVRTSGLDRLSTWGTLQHVDRAHILALLAAVERAGWVVSAGGLYPTVDLTDAGAAVMTAGHVPALWLPRDLRLEEREADARRAPAPGPAPPSSAAASAAAPWVTPETRLLRALSAWRLAQARNQHVAPRIVLGDRTLQALVRLRPRTPAELQQVPGLGPSRVLHFGRDLLAVIRAG